MAKKLSSIRSGERLKKIRIINKLSKAELISLVNQSLDPKQHRNILNEGDITNIEQGQYLANHTDFDINMYKNKVYKNIVDVLRKNGRITIYLDYILHGKLAKIDDFCLRLWELRTRKGMTQKDIVAATGENISQGQLAKYENGSKYPSPNTTELIAKALGISVHQLTNQPDDYQSTSNIVQFKDINEHGLILLTNQTSFNLPEQLLSIFKTMPIDKVKSLVNQLDNLVTTTSNGSKVKLSCNLLHDSLFD